MRTTRSDTARRVKLQDSSRRQTAWRTRQPATASQTSCRTSALLDPEWHEVGQSAECCDTLSRNLLQIHWALSGNFVQHSYWHIIHHHQKGCDWLSCCACRAPRLTLTQPTFSWGLITWTGLIDAANRSTLKGASKSGPVDPKEYLRNPLWWAGSKFKQHCCVAQERLMECPC